MDFAEGVLTAIVVTGFHVSPRWPQTHYVAEDDFGLLPCLYFPVPILCSAKD